jgi:hypothetical protein
MIQFNEPAGWDLWPLIILNFSKPFKQVYPVRGVIYCQNISLLLTFCLLRVKRKEIIKPKQPIIAGQKWVSLSELL